jgi:hypothetical protein
MPQVVIHLYTETQHSYFQSYKGYGNLITHNAPGLNTTGSSVPRRNSGQGDGAGCMIGLTVILTGPSGVTTKILIS